MKTYILRHKFEGYWNATQGVWTPSISEAYKYSEREMLALVSNINKQYEAFVQYPAPEAK